MNARLARNNLVLLAIVAALLIAPLGMRSYSLNVLSTWAVMSVAAIGLNVTLGFAGQVSMAQGAFVGIGAYTVGILTAMEWPFLPCLAVAILLCLALGWIVGYPALRVRSHYLVFVTLAFTTLAYLVFRNEEWLTGGTNGIPDIPRPEMFGISFESDLAYCYFCLLNLAWVSAAVMWLVNSPWGLAFLALRENPVKAQALGVDTRRYTLVAFALGSALGGIAGTLYAPLVAYIDDNAFTLNLSLNLMLMVMVGGSGRLIGPYLGALVVVVLPELLRIAGDYYLMGYGALIVLLMIFCPSGLAGLPETLRARRGATP